MINIFFDLDGPIVDVSDRYYRAYLESLKDLDSKTIKFLEKNDFWELKRNRITDFEIGLLSGLNIHDSKVAGELRKDLSFRNDFLVQDKLFDDVCPMFDFLKSQKVTFCIVTLRRKKQLALAIKQFKLDKYIKPEFAFSLEDAHKITNDIQEKYILLVSAMNKLDVASQKVWFIGDTETDVFAGRLAKVSKVVAISRGIRSKEQLDVVKPDYLINNLTEVVNLFKDSYSKV